MAVRPLTRTALEALVGADRVVDPGLVTAGEDVGLLASAADVPCVFWLLGGSDPAQFAGACSAGRCSTGVSAGHRRGLNP